MTRPRRRFPCLLLALTCLCPLGCMGGPGRPAQGRTTAVSTPAEVAQQEHAELERELTLYSD